jgi:hypothetical protein
MRARAWPREEHHGGVTRRAWTPEDVPELGCLQQPQAPGEALATCTQRYAARESAACGPWIFSRESLPGRPSLPYGHENRGSACG